MAVAGIGALLSAGFASTEGEAAAAPNAPLLISPADGHTFRHGEPQVFTVTASDPQARPFTATVTVREQATGDAVAVLETHPAPSGGRARTVALPALTEGSYSWSADATAMLGEAGPESPSRNFTVGRPAMAGAGDLDGVVTYDAPGVPPASCAPTTFEVSAVSRSAVVSAALVGFVGELEVTGSGSSPCEGRLHATGQLTVSVSGEGPLGSTMTCEVLNGTFTRIATAFDAELDGECVVNGFPSGPARWVLAVEVVPLPPGGSITSPTLSATFDGAFAVRTVRQQ